MTKHSKLTLAVLAMLVSALIPLMGCPGSRHTGADHG
jgi:hypothetical protein